MVCLNTVNLNIVNLNVISKKSAAQYCHDFDIVIIPIFPLSSF
jgi:hypothetical protein